MSVNIMSPRKWVGWCDSYLWWNEPTDTKDAHGEIRSNHPVKWWIGRSGVCKNSWKCLQARIKLDTIHFKSATVEHSMNGKIKIDS